MTHYLLAGRVVDADAPDLQTHLAAAHKARQRPSCLCRGRAAPVPMYLARHGQLVVIKRWPNGGAAHDADCDHYQVPAALSGRGALEETAIKEDEEKGETELRVAFSLRKMPGRAPPTGGGESGDDVKTESAKLTLLATLHYLWDEAGLTRWTPAMAGKRSWGTVYRYVGHAIAGKRTKGAALVDAVLLPEPYRAEEKDEHAKRVKARVAPLGRTKPPQLLLCIGEMKSLEPSRFGMKLLVKHLPEYPFFMEEDAGAKICKRYAPAFELGELAEGAHLVAAFTFSVTPTGTCRVERFAMMATDKNWLPCESSADLDLTAALVDGGRRFRKGLRYNLGRDRALAGVLLSDTVPATGLFVAPLDVDGNTWREEAVKLAGEAQIDAWVWCPAEEERPALPPAAAPGASAA
ncbi:MAG: DUF1173 domain-containing protein [Nitrospira sp.]|nr:DUF1173 domain-containing protein [Nitrospira sp.]MBS0194361.1 DUF1173 domain-containing protein [Pseudomonadota bacterium]